MFKYNDKVKVKSGFYIGMIGYLKEHRAEIGLGDFYNVEFHESYNTFSEWIHESCLKKIEKIKEGINSDNFPL